MYNAPLRVILILLSLSISIYNLHANKGEAYRDNIIQDFGQRLQDSIMTGHYTFFDETILLDSIINRVVLNKSDPDIRMFNEGFSSGIASSFRMGQEIYNALGEAGIYSFISYSLKEDIYYLIFSMYSANGLNYHELEVIIDNGNPRIIDIFLFITGETISKTLRDNYLIMMQQMGYSETLKGKSEVNVNDFLTFVEIKDLYYKGEYKKAYKKLGKISSGFEGSKMYAVYKSMLLAKIDEKEYLEYLTTINELNGNNPSIYLHSIDYLFLNGKYYELLNSLDNLDAIVGGDPILDMYRGNTFFVMGKYLEALIHYEKLKESLPNYSYGYNGILISYLERLDYNNAIASLDEIMLIFNFSIKEIENMLIDYPDFLKSDGYNEWKKEFLNPGQKG